MWDSTKAAPTLVPTGDPYVQAEHALRAKPEPNTVLSNRLLWTQKVTQRKGAVKT